MREILPGDPAEAGPDTRWPVHQDDWRDLLMFAEEKSCFARRRFNAQSRESRRQVIDAVSEARQHFDEVLNRMEALNAR